jgi:hypothetical protein
LGNSGALPGFPSLEGHRRLCRRISFKNRDAVAVATKHSRRAQSDHTSTAEHNFAHLYPQMHLWLDANANLLCKTLQGAAWLPDQDAPSAMKLSSPLDP